MSRQLTFQFIADNQLGKHKGYDENQLTETVKEWIKQANEELQTKVEITCEEPYLLVWEATETEEETLQVRANCYIRKNPEVKISWNNILGAINKIKVCHFYLK